MNKPFDFNSNDYVTEKIEDYYVSCRVNPFTAIEKSIARNRMKKGLKVKINSTDSPEEVTCKILKMIEDK